MRFLVFFANPKNLCFKTHLNSPDFDACGGLKQASSSCGPPSSGVHLAPFVQPSSLSLFSAAAAASQLPGTCTSAVFPHLYTHPPPPPPAVLSPLNGLSGMLFPPYHQSLNGASASQLIDPARLLNSLTSYLPPSSSHSSLSRLN